MAILVNGSTGYYKYIYSFVVLLYGKRAIFHLIDQQDILLTANVNMLINSFMV